MRFNFQKTSVLILFIAIFLKFPLALVYCFYNLPHHSAFEFSSDAIIATLAFFFILFKNNTKLPATLPTLAVLTFIAAVIVQSLFFFRADYLLSSLLPILLIVFGWRYGAECRKLMPFALGVFWLFNFVLSLRKLNDGDIQHGLTGNWNWSASLLIIATAALCYLIYKSDLRRSVKNSVIVIIVIASLWQFSLYPSRGALLALFGTLFCFGVIALLRRNRNAGIVVLSLFALVAIAAVTIIVLKFDKIHDARVYLFPSALRIIAKHPWLGVSPWLYEDFAFLNSRPGYFLQIFVAERSPHPHNQFLFVAASYGLPAFIAWFYLVFRPLPTVIKKTFTAESSLLLFSFMVLLISGMVDVTLESWPCKYLFLLIAGIFWHDFMPSKRLKPQRNAKIFAQAVAVMFLCTALYFIVLTAWSSWLYRSGCKNVDIANGPVAIRQFAQSAQIMPTPFALYRAGLIALYDAKQPDAALSYFSQIPALTGRKNFLNYNNVMARIYCLSNEPEKALPYFEKETQLYPYGVLNWFFYAQTLEKLGRAEQAAVAKTSVETALKEKGLTMKDLPHLMKNHILDLKPHLLPKYLKTGSIE
ncbi:MAG: O-antigen ligase family protein [Victivallaceae bacterium]|nr:O-antigen ligase family protein [Victivallaceae bacterium]